MVVVPSVPAVTKPVALTVATAVFNEVQRAWVVTSRVVLSENVQRARYCWVAPIGRFDCTAIGCDVWFPDDDLPPHVLRNMAEDPRDIIARAILLIFIS